MEQNRRRFLRNAAWTSTSAAATLALTGGNASAMSPRHRPPTFVFVNGNSNNAFCWTPLVRELGLLGHRSIPVELPGHGLDADFYDTYQAPQDLATYTDQPSKLAAITLADYAEATVEIVRRAAEHGPVVLIGHSLGGATLSRVGNAVPELISRLVYLSAICCTRLRTPLACVGAPENSGAYKLTMPSLGSPVTTRITRLNLRSADPEFLAGYREAAMAEATHSQFLAALNYAHQPDESAYVSDEDASGRPNTWGQIPRSYVHFTRDCLLTLPLQQRMVADADATTPTNKFDTHELVASHLGGILFRTRELAQILNKIARHR